LVPILIRGYASRPVGAEVLPGVVQAHGLGGFAKEQNATGPAALLGMFVIAYTGPGGGTEPENTSQGRSAGYDGGYRMFDVIPDTRGTWFWGHTMAGLRALTCLETRSDVDANRLGMTGYSGGGVATLIAAGADDRIKVAVPLSATLAWDVATEAPKAWQHTLLTEAGLDTDSEQWNKLIDELIDPHVALAGANAKILMVNGSTDEFFPLTAHMATYDAIPDTDKRTSIVANLDHGCYAITGIENTGDIETRAETHANGGQRMWFRHWFGTDSLYNNEVPEPPVVEVTPVGLTTLVSVAVDGGGSNFKVDHAHIWWSNDNSRIYGSVELEISENGGFHQQVALYPTQANTVY
ncbi:MAG: prolyl oligopeptidase family serine peptidase, partial [Alphaproteobacteria bacterium]|nr:prolyl oligopeptidase family serine peptidase [Alphaproteobacteria bacterium]